MTVLVLGASGLLGSNVTAIARDHGTSVVGTYHTTEPNVGIDCYQCDLTDSERTTAVIDHVDPNLIVNCAAMTDVDECEQNPDAAHAINADAPGRIAAQCVNRDISFVHISTDYVFDGKQRTPYVEDDDLSPVQVYGRTKLEGEHSVRTTASDAIIVRLSFVYGVHRSSDKLTGFPAWVRSELEADNEISLFTDQYITPSRAGQAAETILNLAEEELSGTFHVTCRDCVTPYQFGRRIAERINTEESPNKGSRTDVDLVARRPAYTCLNVCKVERTLGRSQPTLREDLNALAV